MTMPGKRAAAFLLGGALVAALGHLDSAGAASRPTVKDFMTGLGFSASQMTALDGGEIVSRVLKVEMAGPNESAEVAVLGAVRVDVSRQAFIDAVKDLPSFRGDAHQKISLIHAPPQASDFAGLVLPADDIKDLKDCRPGHCALRLSGDSVAKLQSEVDWKSADASERVNALGRERLLAIATAYTREGTAAIHPMLDASTAVNTDEQFRELVQRTPPLIAFYPEFADYVRDYPKVKLASSSEGLYWTLNAFGLKPTVTLVHAIGYAPPGTEDVIVAWKQLYASHYFNGALGITIYVRDGSTPYLIHLDRVRADGLGGAFGGIKRGKMAGAMEGQLRAFLKEAVDDLKTRAGK